EHVVAEHVVLDVRAVVQDERDPERTATRIAREVQIDRAPSVRHEAVVDGEPMAACSVDLFDLRDAGRVAFVDVQVDVVAKRRVQRKSTDFTVTTTDVVDMKSMEL